MADRISVPRRFNGPVESGHGGYCAGVFAGVVDGLAQVSLRRPVPLDRPLAAVGEGDGSARVLDGGALVAEVRSVARLDAELRAPVSVEQARLARERYRGSFEGVFSRCFVCGRARDDAFGVFAGAVAGRALVASPWVAPRWTADLSGSVLAAFVWAVLDCPTYFATYRDEQLGPAVLAQLAVRIDAPVVAGDEHVVTAWPIEAVDRKRQAGAALLSRDGEPLAVARALMVEPRAG